MDYLISNKEWIFSGVGVFIIGAIFNLYRSKNIPKSQTSGYSNGSNNIHLEGNVVLDNNNTTTIVYKDVEAEPPKKPLSELIYKFYFIFEKHGVSRGQIPSFIDKKFNINYADVASEESIIPKLNDELLEWVSSKFGIRRCWFDATDEDYYSKYMYDTIDCYKWVGVFINLFSKLIDEFNVYGYKDSIHVYFLKTFGKFKGDKSGEEGTADVIVVVSVKIGETTTNIIEKYILVTRNLRWDYWKSRQDIKRMIRTVDKLGIRMCGYDISMDEYKEIVSAQVVPRAILNKKKSATWHPYDYDGTRNKKIDEVEYEPDKQFYESLKEIDDIISKMIDEKREQYSNRIWSDKEE
ncbi:hypothetical protein [Paenibacillus silagei]|uniref:Uncharacterized protein n=1 Tax=Paenibacillus silagei TaxID=1670801 RepID=A0ABS4NKB3_9BACL|nr:hypothetical protein [Paenibacillus silagei]MBP2110504.1 hypothetical protein [Paenibacillus silagei]